MFLFIMIMAFSASSMALQTTSAVAESKSDISTDLVAPLPSSISQYYQPPALLNIQLLKQQQELLQQPQTLAQLLGLQQRHQPILVQQNNQQDPKQPILIQQNQQTQPLHHSQINPFLYLGQLTSSDTGEYTVSNSQPLLKKQQQNLLPKKRSDERSLQNQERSSYDLYRPSPDEAHEFVDMAPPSESQEEPNYYVMMIKPRKFKKYVEQDVTEKKLKARKESNKLKHQIKRSKEQETPQIEDDTDSLTESTDDVEQSEPTSRLDFQMHGHKGPKSYKFGFDYGSNAGLNRQFRVEERDSNGDVHGKYGYYDRKGRFKTVNYSSTAKDGFRVHT